MTQTFLYPASPSARPPQAQRGLSSRRSQSHTSCLLDPLSRLRRLSLLHYYLYVYSDACEPLSAVRRERASRVQKETKITKTILARLFLDSAARPQALYGVRWSQPLYPLAVAATALRLPPVVAAAGHARLMAAGCIHRSPSRRSTPAAGATAAAAVPMAARGSRRSAPPPARSTPPRRSPRAAACAPC